jgi:hypothetical protein
LRVRLLSACLAAMPWILPDALRTGGKGQQPNTGTKRAPLPKQRGTMHDGVVPPSFRRGEGVRPPLPLPKQWRARPTSYCQNRAEDDGNALLGQPGLLKQAAPAWGLSGSSLVDWRVLARCGLEGSDSCQHALGAKPGVPTGGTKCTPKLDSTPNSIPCRITLPKPTRWRARPTGDRMTLPVRGFK